MTINQAIDKLTNCKELNEEQRKLRNSLVNFKVQFGGRTEIDNKEEVVNIIEFGCKERKKD